MAESIDRILKEYQAGRMDREEANAALAEAGAGYHLEALTAEQRAAKAAQEYREGYIPAAEAAEPVQRELDRRRRPELAGRPGEERKIIQRTARGKFLVEYDDQGYYVGASKIKGGTEHA